MNWRDLLQKDEHVTLPWVGGRTLEASDGRLWKMTRTPREFGWYQFKVQSRTVVSFEAVPAESSILRNVRTGYLVGNCLVVPDEHRKFKLRTVHLVEDALDRFSRVSAGSITEDGPLIYQGQEMPLGPEDRVLDAFLNREGSVAQVPGVSPELEAAFWFESRHRTEQERHRAELEARRLQEERQRELEQRIGTGQGRRELARFDFDSAAKAALIIGGAEFLDSRQGNDGTRVVRFRFNNRRFECICDLNLQIIDAGICLRAEYDDGEFEQGTQGDTWFTLESLPMVIQSAIDQNRLVVFRHA